MIADQQNGTSARSTLPSTLPLRRSRENCMAPVVSATTIITKPQQQAAERTEGPSVPTNLAATAALAASATVRCAKSEEEFERVFAELAAAGAQNFKQGTGDAFSWAAVIVHAPWAWPNVDGCQGFVASCAERNSAAAPADNEPAPLSWQWILRESQVPIVCVSVADVPGVAQLLRIRSKTLPLICLRRFDHTTASSAAAAAAARWITVAQKECRTCIDVASQTLFTPVTNARELDALVESEKARSSSSSSSSNGHAVIVAYVGSPWCAPCVRIMPHLPQLGRTYSAARVVKIDFDVGHQLAEEIGVEKIPTFSAFRIDDDANVDASGRRMPFGSLQHSDIVRVSDSVQKWCDLAAARQDLNDDLFTSTDDF